VAWQTRYFVFRKTTIRVCPHFSITYLKRQQALVREFRLAWLQAKEEREKIALKALLLCIKTHYPSLYRRYFEAQGMTLEWTEVDGRLLKLSRMARAKFANGFDS
jgi:hypothetical protein